MTPNRVDRLIVVITGLAVGGAWFDALAQDSKSDGKSAGATTRDPGLPVASPGDQVVIKRDAIQPLDPHRFRLSLYLTPAKSVTLVAPHDGIVVATTAKLGDSLPARSEVLRIDDTVQKFQLQRAQGLYKAAVLDQKIGAETAKGDAKDLAQAKVDAAKAELDLAQYRFDQSTQRLPFGGEVIRYLVTEGQFVKAGEQVAIVGDTSKMQVEIPVERSQVEKGKSLRIKVDGAEVEGEVVSILPLNQRFDSLRELFDSLASAMVVIENSKRTLLPGQTVFVPVIPRHPVAEIPSSAIANGQSGGRKVQVLRDSVVRDIPVSLMGSVGLDRVFVNGPFAAGDEVIVEASHQLADGFPVKHSSGKAKKPEGSNAGGNPATKGGTPKPDF